MQPALLPEKWKGEEEEEWGNDKILPTTVGNCLQCWDVTGRRGGFQTLQQAQTEIRWTVLLLRPGAVCEREHLPPGTVHVSNLISQLQPNQSGRLIYFQDAGTGGWEVERKQGAD